MVVIATELVAVQAAKMFIFEVSFGDEPEARFAVEQAGPILSTLAVLDPDNEHIVDEFVGLAGLDKRITIHRGDEALAVGTFAPTVTAAVREAAVDDWKTRLTVQKSSEPYGWTLGPFSDRYVLFVDLGGDVKAQFRPGDEIVLHGMAQGRWIILLLVIAGPLVTMVIWSKMMVVTPMSALARNAGSTSNGGLGADERSWMSPEIRAAADSVTESRNRVRAQIRQRSLALAAIGHDMRTPLTRLRLRMETQSSVRAVDEAASDISEIEAMINDALEFFMLEHQAVDCQRADIAILCRTICDEFSDAGAEVNYLGPAHLVGNCDMGLLKRAIENLVKNATLYAGRCEVDVEERTPETATVTVVDFGPGISADDLEIAKQPFERLHQKDAPIKGSGLGLAITQQLVDRQNGRLDLRANSPTGLRAEVTIPTGAGSPELTKTANSA